jgi:uncharacterized protein (DUF486 family)
MSAAIRAALLLVFSNLFMTYAWYGHLRVLAGRPWFVVAVIAWGVAFFEYQLQVPANRIGYTVMSLQQLKVLQECISLLVFIPFAVFFMKAPLTWDFLWASLCIVGAVFFAFRAH